MSTFSTLIFIMLGQADHSSDSKLQLWNDFVTNHQIVEQCVPLFEMKEGHVTVMPYGATGRPVLKKSEEMEKCMRDLGMHLIHQHREGKVEHDGILYMMLKRQGHKLTPLYIGKAEIYGRGEKNLSVNISDLAYGDGKFGRWGYGYAYHLGDLSAATLSGHPAEKVEMKYSNWSKTLFVVQNERVTPRFEIMFWATLWGPQSKSIWREYGTTRLAFEEFLLIGVASDAFPNELLNREGRSR